MNKEQKETLIQEIIGILHKDAGTIYDAKGTDDETRIALDQDYFNNAAESILNYCENMFNYFNRKNSLEFEVQILNAKLEHYSAMVEKCDLLEEDRDRYKTKYEDLVFSMKTKSQDPREN